MEAEKAQIADVLNRYATGIDIRDRALLRTCWPVARVQAGA